MSFGSVAPRGHFGSVEQATSGSSVAPLLGQTIGPLAVAADYIDILVDGQTAGGFELVGQLLLPVNASGQVDIFLEPNGLTVNQVCNLGFDQTGTGAAGNFTATIANPNQLDIGALGVSGGTRTFNFTTTLLNTATGGRPRRFLSSSFRDDFVSYRSQGWWNDTTTPITFLRITTRKTGAIIVSGILAGSSVSWTELGRPE